MCVTGSMQVHYGIALSGSEGRGRLNGRLKAFPLFFFPLNSPRSLRALHYY